MKNLVVFYLGLFFCLIFGISKSQMSFTLASQTCENANLTLTSNPGTLSPLSYSWTSSPTGALFSAPNASFSSLSFTNAGSYTISLFVSTSTGTIVTVRSTSVRSFPIAALSDLSTTVCLASANLSVSGADTYNWAPASGLSATTGSAVSAFPQSSTVYSITGHSSLCGSSTINFSVSAGVLPVIVFVPTSSYVCVGETSTITGFGALTYTWTGTTFTNSITQPSISVPFGTYTLTGSNGGDCSSSSVFYIGLRSCTGLTESKKISSSFSLYPNPVSETLYLKNEDLIFTDVEIVDVLCKVVYSKKDAFVVSEIHTIDTRSFPAGVYYLRLSTKDDFTQLQRFVKE